MSKYNGVYWGIYSNTTTSSNFYILGATYSATNVQGATAAIDFTGSIGIDTKLDDGLANSGTVQGFATLATSPDGNVTNGALTYTAGTLYALRFRVQGMQFNIKTLIPRHQQSWWFGFLDLDFYKRITTFNKYEEI